MNKYKSFTPIIIGWILLLSGLILLTGWLDSYISKSIAEMISRRAGQNWSSYFRNVGWLFLISGLLFISNQFALYQLKRFSNFLKSNADKTYQWIEQRIGSSIDLKSSRNLIWPLAFTLPDWLIIAFFALLAFMFQLSAFSNGFPTVILGGDAANIASFAAGRAFPQLFLGDAILGDLRNIGLYVTIHLPITIWLEKLLGNFGLAYSVLLLPHVFLQYFSYYLLGRNIFNNRYWAFLFSLAISAPLELAGGEMWGIVGDGMPRFTYQVLIPFILILLLSTWRNKPQRWPWVMVMAGLMAFIHPVSTPAWAFALWLGLWPCMPASFEIRRKLREMAKNGLILALALLPYVSIYLYYHKGGRSNSNYDLVYYILNNYFPYNLLNIPAAVQTLISSTSQYGLLWYGLFGLIITFVVFHTEHDRLKQMLTWMAGISFVTIIVPFFEQIIERSLRIIPLQTELMRGMRYLVPFLFIFWFYPFAELTNRALKTWIVRTSFVMGTLLTIGWLIVNPPYPFTAAPPVFQCWTQGQFICPGETEYSDALSFIQNETPENAKFVVFLTNRWSGIEVRYLGLRPMAYAYKDRGQLAFTNLEALQTWFYFLNRENAIFSNKNSPKLDDKRKRMIDFAQDAEANYMLTNFAFPPDVSKNLGVTIVFQNKSYTILNIYNMRQ